jgi:hypothetical protein
MAVVGPLCAVQAAFLSALPSALVIVPCDRTSGCRRLALRRPGRFPRRPSPRGERPRHRPAAIRGMSVNLRHCVGSRHASVPVLRPDARPASAPAPLPRERWRIGFRLCSCNRPGDLRPPQTGPVPSRRPRRAPVPRRALSPRLAAQRLHLEGAARPAPASWAAPSRSLATDGRSRRKNRSLKIVVVAFGRSVSPQLSPHFFAGQNATWSWCFAATILV